MDSKAMKAEACGRPVMRPAGKGSSHTPPVKVDTSILGSRKRACQSLEQLDHIAEFVRHDEDITFDEKQRKMAIIYSRRKRLRHKQKLRELHAQQDALLAENERVRRENDQLDAMIRGSMAVIAVHEQERITSAARLAQAVRAARRQSALAELVTPTKDMGFPRFSHSQSLALELLAAQRLKALEAFSPPPSLAPPQDTLMSRYFNNEHDFARW